MARAARREQRQTEPRTVYPDTAGRFEIRTPNPEFKGVRHNVQFVDGVGRTDDPARAEAMRELGYEVKELRPEGAKEK